MTAWVGMCLPLRHHPVALHSQCHVSDSAPHLCEPEVNDTMQIQLAENTTHTVQALKVCKQTDKTVAVTVYNTDTPSLPLPLCKNSTRHTCTLRNDCLLLYCITSYKPVMIPLVKLSHSYQQSRPRGPRSHSEETES